MSRLKSLVATTLLMTAFAVQTPALAHDRDDDDVVLVPLTRSVLVPVLPRRFEEQLPVVRERILVPSADLDDDMPRLRPGLRVPLRPVIIVPDLDD